MNQINLLCKIGSYLPINDILSYLMVSKKINCELFWRLYYEQNYAHYYKVKSDEFYKVQTYLKSMVKKKPVSREIDNYYEQTKLLSLLVHTQKDYVVTKDNLLHIESMMKLCLSTSFCFLTLKHLKKIELSDIENFIGNNLPNLKRLSLKNISKFENNNIPKLKDLYLRYNYLESINVESFLNLKYLDVSFGNLKELNVLKNKKLKSLNISNTDIKIVNCYEKTKVTFVPGQIIINIW